MRFRILILALVLVTGSLGVSGAQKAKSHARTHTVTMTGLHYDPPALTLKAGDTVVWVNKDLVAHTATSKVGGFDSSIVQPEKSWKTVVKRKGDVPYGCSFHPAMKGTLHVQ